MATKPDLNKLKTEIASRKREKSIAPVGMGAQNQLGASPRDTFLNGLLESLKTGRDTASSNLVKIVDNQVAAKHKETARLPINETVTIIYTWNGWYVTRKRWIIISRPW